MLSFTGGLKIFVAREPCDMRKGFGSFSGEVYDQLKEDVRNVGCSLSYQQSAPFTVIEA